MNWNLRHCARRGHSTYIPTDAALTGRLTVETPVGLATRCLRCGDFVLGTTVAAGLVAAAPKVARGKALRDLFIMRLLALDRGLKALLLILAAFGVLRFKSAQQGIDNFFTGIAPLLGPLWKHLGVNIDHTFLIRQSEAILATTPNTLTLVVVGLFIYGGIQLSECIGLWLARVWGEYLAVVASSAFLPIEIYEIVDSFSLWKVAVLIVNIAAVVWLITSKRLFGVRGGQPAHHAALASESILDTELDLLIAAEKSGATHGP